MDLPNFILVCHLQIWVLNICSLIFSNFLYFLESFRGFALFYLKSSHVKLKILDKIHNFINCKKNNNYFNLGNTQLNLHSTLKKKIIITPQEDLFWNQKRKLQKIELNVDRDLILVKILSFMTQKNKKVIWPDMLIKESN